MDIASVVSMVMVILIHVGAISWYDPPFSLYPWGVINIMDIFARFCVPVFLMMSGYLFLDPKRNIPTKKIYTRYLPRLVTAFLFWGFLYAVITSGLLTQRTLSNGVGVKLIQDTLWGHYHMWYLYVIISMYILTPALRAIAADRKALKYFLVAGYIVSYAIPGIMMIPVIYEHAGRYFNRFEFFFFSGYVFYYVAGYYMATEDFSEKAKKIIYLLGLLGFAGTVITVTAYVITVQYPDSTYHEYYTAGLPLYSLAAFLFFKEKFKEVNPDTKIMKIVMWLSRLSFGVYLAHDFGLIVFKKIGLTPMICTPFISMPLLTILDLIITVTIAWIVSLIPGLKKWVI